MQFLPLIGHHAGDTAIADVQLGHFNAQRQFAALVTIAFQQTFQEGLHAMVRPTKALEDDAPENDAELIKVHVLGLGIAIQHHRAQQHVLQKR